MDHFNRSNDYEPGTWKPLTLPDRMSATINCPRCGQHGTLEDHAISIDGKVEPSVICPNDQCGYHESVQLLGWPPIDQRAYQS
jgi:hypothetical protein